MMLKKFACLTAALVIVPMTTMAAEDPAEVAAVIAAVKATNPDFRALCQTGPDNIKKVIIEAVMSLMSAGKLKGNPQAVGGEAGQTIGRECRG